MATSLELKPLFFSLIITLLFIILHSQIALAFSFDFEDPEVYVLDNPPLSFTSRSRYFPSIIRKGTHCNPDSNNNICNGVSANNGTSLLYCCKTHCRNILGDRNNCGKCGSKCKFGQLCCNGSCTYVGDNENHCGKCHKKCPNGVKCEGGMCGYA
ncbi:Stigma-specific Stig1 family protein [Melia azedarach]|uniref:Stigma-specific Stig1 family protein n=1 Tax=Melia azedarach TaxID=155640 RepID=A0ACC1YSB3_MELAZ|nr:Stigma-specific Stig1 family protein [Melia azedarach]